MNGQLTHIPTWISGNFGNEPRWPHAREDEAGGLGSARAVGHWRWAHPNTPHALSQHPLAYGPGAGGATERRVVATSASAVRIPEAILRLMREAAWRAGRTESEIWAEAAREWLTRRMLDDEPQPPTPAAAALPLPRVVGAWEAIDLVLHDLRKTPRLDPSPAVPAA
jgi:hypothetical protein